jgi:hypothetical protein
MGPPRFLLGAGRVLRKESTKTIPANVVFGAYLKVTLTKGGSSPACLDPDSWCFSRRIRKNAAR